MTNKVRSFVASLFSFSPVSPRRDLRGLLCFVVVLSAYLCTLPTALTEGDAGEWLVIAKHGGIPHPSGYPLYATLCRLFGVLLANLPLVTALAVLSALCCAFAAWVAYATLKLLGFGSLVATVSTLVVMTSGAVWRMATIPEPFALNILFCSAVLLLAVQVYARGSSGMPTLTSRAAVCLGIVFAFGFCNHHSLVWLAPFGLYVLISGWHRLWAVVVCFVGGLVVGLAPLTYFLVARHDTSPYDYYPLNTFTDLWRLLFRVSYGTWQLAHNHQERNWESLGYFVGHLPTWFSFLFLVPVLIGMVVLVGALWRSRPWVQRGLWLAWLMSFGLSSVLFFGLFNVRVESWIPSIIERFMALPAFLLIVPLALGLRWSLALFKAQPQAQPSRVVHAGLLLLLLGHGLWQGQRANRANEVFFESHIGSVFGVLPFAGDVLITASDTESLGAMYGRHVLGLGDSHLLWLNALYWKSERFRRNTVAAWSMPAQYADLSLSSFVGALVESRGRVVVTDLPLPPRPSFFDHAFTVGPLTIVVRQADPLPSPDEIWKLNLALLADTHLPSCAGGSALKAWDAALLAKYRDGLAELMESFAAQQRTDLRDQAQAKRDELDQCLF